MPKNEKGLAPTTLSIIIITIIGIIGISTFLFVKNPKLTDYIKSLLDLLFGRKPMCLDGVCHIIEREPSSVYFCPEDCSKPCIIDCLDTYPDTIGPLKLGMGYPIEVETCVLGTVPEGGGLYGGKANKLDHYRIKIGDNGQLRLTFETIELPQRECEPLGVRVFKERGTTCPGDPTGCVFPSECGGEVVCDPIPVLANEIYYIRIASQIGYDEEKVDASKGRIYLTLEETT